MSDCISRKRSSYLATISYICCTIFCSQNTKTINVRNTSTDTDESNRNKHKHHQHTNKLTPYPKWRLQLNAGTSLWSAHMGTSKRNTCVLPGTWRRWKSYFRPLTAAPHVLGSDTKKRTHSALGPQIQSRMLYRIIIQISFPYWINWNLLEFVLAISLISLGSSHTFFLPHLITEAASLFCSLREL